MTNRLKKDYFSMPAGTIVEVYIKGMYYEIRNKTTGFSFALFTKEQKDEFIEFINTKK